MNIAQVLVDSVPLLQTSSPVVNIIAVLIPILISRFLLNLRQLGEPENETQSRFNSRFSIPGFRVPTLASIVGDMGADLDHGPAEEVNEETDDADVNARLGNEGTAAIDAVDELQSSVATMETIYEIQEVPRDAV
ncbi:hypothetical protein EW026_g7750 [Hermanssonia centrifuga]|uniref:Uncharacterized protein n=1 Tax=Hermanssonia centrifuga TaxID=98765 RepID=A0A4S4K6Q4_9APHY|nr:hypothetical protein EW026_g7750 [Hermanssonia centrifuga]